MTKLCPNNLRKTISPNYIQYLSILIYCKTNNPLFSCSPSFVKAMCSTPAGMENRFPSRGRDLGEGGCRTLRRVVRSRHFQSKRTPESASTADDNARAPMLFASMYPKIRSQIVVVRWSTSARVGSLVGWELLGAEGECGTLSVNRHLPCGISLESYCSCESIG